MSQSEQEPQSSASQAANAEVLPTPDERGRFLLPRLSRAWVIALSILSGLLVLAIAGVAYATYDYSQRYEGKILPGAMIAGVDVGGMPEDAAIAAVRNAIRPQLDRPITVAWRDRTWTVTPRELGAHGDSEAAVEEALAASADASFFDKMQMRLLGSELPFERAIAIRHSHRGVRGFVQGIASGLERDAVDAGVDYSTGWLEFEESRVGRDVNVDKSKRSLMRALKNGEDEAGLTVAMIKPEVLERRYDQTLLLRIGENKLYLYEDGEITHEWLVATGQPEYPTPTGEYEITLKRYMPTWVNPDPTGWGANMPASIPPGPGNPLGLRALNWDAAAIRFHGTSAVYSLGYNASHGCVRLKNEDVIELYDLVDIGTPIVSTIVAPLRPLYSSSPDPIVVAEDAEEDSPRSDAGDADQRRSTDGKKGG